MARREKETRSSGKIVGNWREKDQIAVSVGFEFDVEPGAFIGFGRAGNPPAMARTAAGEGYPHKHLIAVRIRVRRERQAVILATVEE